MKTNTPETYFDYYRKNGITGIIRFNNKVYDRKKFLDAGFNRLRLPARDPEGPLFRRPLPGRRGMTQLMGDGGGWGRGGEGDGRGGPTERLVAVFASRRCPAARDVRFLAGGQGPERRLAKRGVGWACRLRV